MTVTEPLAAPRALAREVPFCRTEITPEAQQAALDALRSGWVTMGPLTGRFEEELAAWVGAAHVVAVSSCTVAIEMALATLDLPAGSPVLTPTLTFCGAVQAIVQAGLRPVLVDTDPATLGVSPAGVAAAAARAGIAGRQAGTAAMVVQHMAGYPLDRAVLAAAAGIPVRNVVDDAAHGLGAALGGRPLGGAGRAVCFSFYATKNLPIWEGGAIATDDADLADRLRRVRLHGMSGDAWRRYHRSGSWRYTVAESGRKANFTDVQAAVGRAQLARLHGWQQRRAEIAARYDGLLRGVPGVELPPRPERDTHAWHLYAIQVHPELGAHRDDVVDELARHGIGSSVHFIPVHHQPYFRSVLGPQECASCPQADAIFPTLLSLPMHPGLSDADVADVCAVLAALATRG